MISKCVYTLCVSKNYFVEIQNTQAGKTKYISDILFVSEDAQNMMLSQWLMAHATLTLICFVIYYIRKQNIFTYGYNANT